MKAGTTFLFNALQRHPELYFTPEKEIHFLAHLYGFEPNMTESPFVNLEGQSWNGLWPDTILTQEYRLFRLSQVMKNRYSKTQDASLIREVVRWYTDQYLPGDVDIHWCRNIFTACGSHQWGCEFSNYNALLSRQGVEFARANYPGVKVLFMLRHPVGRLWSHIKFDLQFNGKYLSPDNLTASEVINSAATGHFSAYSRYGDIVQHLFSSFGEENVMVLCMEDLLCNFESVMKQLENFLNIAHVSYQVDVEKKVNRSERLELDSATAEFWGAQAVAQLDKLRDLGVRFPDSYYCSSAF